MTRTERVDHHLVRQLEVRWGAGLIIVGGLLFGTAGSFGYWPAWLYIGILFVPMSLVGVYFLRRDPELLRRRIQYKEQQSAQRWVQLLGSLSMAGGFLLTGLDYRFGWSHLPPWLVVAANVSVLGGYALFFFVLRANSYASRVVEVTAEQRLITTGPYAWVRHPMYTSVLVMFLLTPLALGSWVAVPAFAPLVPLLVLRIRDEERLLRAELAGYAEYREQVRFRLLPGIW